jgi:hypothetical protein
VSLTARSVMSVPDGAVVRSLAYGGEVIVTFISIAYVGGLPFVGVTA